MQRRKKETQVLLLSLLQLLPQSVEDKIRSLLEELT